MRVTFLGTGTSVGIPVIGCRCAVCTSSHPRNKRRRTSLYLVAAGVHVVVDTSPDFREQALACGIPRVDAVLFTHSHADHIFGFDDIRRYNTMQDAVIPAYAGPGTMADLKRVFNYVGQEKTEGVYRPRIDFRSVTGAFDLNGLRVTPFEVEHGTTPTYGYLFESGGRRVGYAPDCAAMSDAVVERLRGIDVMILDALRDRPHKTHLTVEASVRLLQRIEAGRSYLVHLCHDLDHDATQQRMPRGVEVSYDGLVLDL